MQSAKTSKSGVRLAEVRKLADEGGIRLGYGEMQSAYVLCISAPLQR
jgi:hypothetical protein